MPDVARQNTTWQTKVRRLLREGWGVWDMVAQFGMDAEDVQREVKILRDSGELNWIYRRPNV